MKTGLRARTTMSPFSAAAWPEAASRGSCARKRRRCACSSSKSGRIRCPRPRSRSANRASRSAPTISRSGSGSSRTCAPSSWRSSGCGISSRNGDNRDITSARRARPGRLPAGAIVPARSRAPREHAAAYRRRAGRDGARRLPRRDRSRSTPQPPQRRVAASGPARLARDHRHAGSSTPADGRGC